MLLPQQSTAPVERIPQLCVYPDDTDIPIYRAPHLLFTFLSERYERKSVIITSNLVFSEWDRIFKDPMTTAAAIDRLVHHAVIVEMTGPSLRNEEAKKRSDQVTATPTATVTASNKESSGKEVDGEM